MMRSGRIKGRGLKAIDWTLVVCYLLLVLIGWINIYASVHSAEPTSIFDLSVRSGKQFIWIVTSLGLAAIILWVINPRYYEGLSLWIYIFMLILLVAVIFLGIEVKGSRSWFAFGPIRLQPAEFSKISTSLFLATVMSQVGYRIHRLKDFLITALIILVPMLIIIGQSETGTALVYVGYIFVLYREGMTGWILFVIGMAILLFILTLTVSSYAALWVLLAVTIISNAIYTKQSKLWFYIGGPILILMAFVPSIFEAICANTSPEAFINKIKPTYILLSAIALATPFITFYAYRHRQKFTHFATIALLGGAVLVYSTDFIFHSVLQTHQRKRIEVLLGMKDDPTGVGYNVNQSMIAIGSGGLTGKGYLKGTQTAYGFVPEQSTDFIFCTVGEEWGFLGAVALILLYMYFIYRIIKNAEKSREAFTRIYGYCVASIIFMHLFINIGMTVGLMPVIGIPLPLISYGGSSLLAFTIMIFIFIALVRNEKKYF